MHGRLIHFLPELTSAVRRFPEATLAACVCTILACALIADPAQNWLLDAYVAAAASFPVLAAVAIHSELCPKGRTWRVVLAIGTAATIGVLFAFRFTADLSPPLLVILALLLPSLAGRWGRARDNDGFWRFNHDLWLGFGMAVLGGGLLAASISAILATVGLLFQVHISNDAYAYSATIAANIAGPLIWLTLIPSAPSRAELEAEDTITTVQTSSRAIALVTKFILVPVLLIYTAIIYFYAAKIAADGVLPKGQIGWMVLLYGAAGTITLLAVYPSRNSGGWLVRIFYRHWFVMALLPVGLLFIAVLTRTEQYGVTDRRYLVILAGVWLISQALLFGFRREEKRDLGAIVASLAFFLAIAMAGPWGAIGSTTRLLAADFNAAAATSLAFADGKFDGDKLDGTERRRLTSIVRYLGEHGRLEFIYGAVAAQVEIKLANVTPAPSEKERRQQAARLADAMGLSGYEIAPEVVAGNTYFSFFAGKPSLVQVQGHLAGPIVLSGTSAYDDRASASFGGPAGEDIKVTLAGKTITVGFGGAGEASFDALAIASQLAALPSGLTGPPPLQRFTALAGGRKVDLLVAAGYGLSTGSRVEISSLTLWVAWSD